MTLLTGARGGKPGPATVAALALVVTTAGCAMAGFGGALQLNITDEQIRPLAIEVSGGSADARLLEIDNDVEVELGTGTARIERYVLHRATFGRDVAVGYFLCPKPCSDPLSSYLVAYSPDRLFNPAGELELRFRIVAADGSEEIMRSVTAEMLPDLWESPTITAGPRQ